MRPHFLPLLKDMVLRGELSPVGKQGQGERVCWGQGDHWGGRPSAAHYVGWLRLPGQAVPLDVPMERGWRKGLSSCSASPAPKERD